MELGDLIARLDDPALPVALKGYDRAATDRFLRELDEGLKSALHGSEAAQARLAELEQRLAERQEREDAIADALVVASKIRADSEREVEEIRNRQASEGEAAVSAAREKAAAIVNEAQGRADAVVKEAGAEARRIVQEAHEGTRHLEARIREADELAQGVKANLATLLESLLAEVRRHDAESPAAVADLLARAGELIRAETNLARSQD